MSKIIHLSLDVKGALMNWKQGQFRGMFKRPDGTKMTANEARAVLVDELAKGHELLPYGDCEGFDYKTGCPGHEAGGGR